jgi:hypothetical protein
MSHVINCQLCWQQLHVTIALRIPFWRDSLAFPSKIRLIGLHEPDHRHTMPSIRALVSAGSPTPDRFTCRQEDSARLQRWAPSCFSQVRGNEGAIHTQWDVMEYSIGAHQDGFLSCRPGEGGNRIRTTFNRAVGRNSPNQRGRDGLFRPVGPQSERTPSSPCK